MNTAFHDALNFAWKVHAVESGFAKRSILESYEAERRQIALNLLDFDAKYATLFSKRRPSAAEVVSASVKQPIPAPTTGQGNAEEGDEFLETFKSSCEFTSGYGVAYPANIFNWSRGHPAKSSLFDIPGVRLTPGKSFTPTTVTRISDANVVALEQEVPADGAFRIFIFAGSPLKTKKALDDFASNLTKENSFLSVYRRPDIRDVSYFEFHHPHSKLFTLCLIFASQKNHVAVSELPQVFKDYARHIYADSIPDVRVPHADFAAHEKLGFDIHQGGVVVVRPDSHVACTVRLVEGSGTVDALNEYFNAFSSKEIGKHEKQSRL